MKLATLAAGVIQTAEAALTDMGMAAQMSAATTRALLAFGIAFVAAVVLTPLVRAAARRYGYINRPKKERWSKRPVALLGGIGIYAAAAGTILLLAPLTNELLGLLVGSTFIFAMGLFDDLRGLRPSQKLVGQFAAAAVAVAFGVEVSFALHPLAGIPITMVWLVGITNAFNLIDNMDGLSTGIAFIGASFLTVFALLEQPTAPVAAIEFMPGWAAGAVSPVAVVAAAVAGASLGFLIYNFNPASIFMGDAGALFLGFILAGAGVIGTWQEASNLALVLAVPVLILGLPIFDTALVTVMRKLRGRAISQGGQDHSSHRLVALGLSERTSVLVLYGISLTFGLAALVGYFLGFFVAAVVVGFVVVVLLFFGIFLGEVKVYREVTEEEAALARSKAGEGPAVLQAILLNKRRIVEVIVDFVLICVAYFGAYLLRFEGVISAENLRLIRDSLPIVIGAQLAAFHVMGMYRGVWRYISLSDVLTIGKAVLLGVVLSVLVLLGFTRFEGFSRALFVLDTILLFGLIVGVRLTLRVLRELVFRHTPRGRRLLVVGAGDLAETLIREMHRRPELELRPVAMVDDDPQKQGKHIHGVPVLGTLDDVEESAKRADAEEVLLAIPPSASAARSRAIQAADRAGLPHRLAPAIADVLGGRHATVSHVADAVAELEKGLERGDRASLQVAAEHALEELRKLAEEPPENDDAGAPAGSSEVG